MTEQTVVLVPITRDNWKECIALSVSEDQRDYVPSNLYSLAEAQFYPDARALGLVTADGVLVGFVLYGRDVLSEKWKLFRLMIDARQQRRGYGRAALRLVVEALRERSPDSEILVCCQARNGVARRLYGQLGFVERSAESDGRVTATLAPGVTV